MTTIATANKRAQSRRCKITGRSTRPGPRPESNALLPTNASSSWRYSLHRPHNTKTPTSSLALKTLTLVFSSSSSLFSSPSIKLGIENGDPSERFRAPRLLRARAQDRRGRLRRRPPRRRREISSPPSDRSAFLIFFILFFFFSLF